MRIFDVSCSFLKVNVHKRAMHRTSPAIVYFPRGTYLVSKPIVMYYYTQLIGDAKTPPTLLAAPSFDGMAVIGTTINQRSR